MNLKELLPDENINYCKGRLLSLAAIKAEKIKPIIIVIDAFFYGLKN